MMASVGENLKQLRKRAKLSRDALAALCGASRGTTVQYWEGGGALTKAGRLPRHIVVKLSRALVGLGNPVITIEDVMVLGDPGAGVSAETDGTLSAPVFLWGDLVDILTARPVTFQPLPETLSGNLFCSILLDEHAARVAPFGSTLIIDGDQKALVDGCFYVISDGAAPVLRRYRQNPARFESLAINPDATLFPSGPVQIIGRAISVITSL